MKSLSKRHSGRYRHRDRSRSRYRKLCIIGRLSIDAGSAIMLKSIPIAIAIPIPIPIPTPNPRKSGHISVRTHV